MSSIAPRSLTSFPNQSCAVIFGDGGIGQAFLAALGEAAAFSQVVCYSRRTSPLLDLTSEASVALCATDLADKLSTGQFCRLFINACGFLHDQSFTPERSLRHLDAAHMEKSFAINAIGPALLFKHFAPLMPRSGKSVFVHLSAKVGSIGDNHLGGWHSYRASKAALNQIVRTTAVELKRSHPDAICLALHPGTVETRLSAPFQKTGLVVRPPGVAVGQMLSVIDQVLPAQSGSFLDYEGRVLPW